MLKNKLNIVETEIDYIFKKYTKNMKYKIIYEPINEYCELYVQSEITQNIYHFTISLLDIEEKQINKKMLSSLYGVFGNIYENYANKPKLECYEKLDRKIIEAIKCVLEGDIIK